VQKEIRVSDFIFYIFHEEALDIFYNLISSELQSRLGSRNLPYLLLSPCTAPFSGERSVSKWSQEEFRKEFLDTQPLFGGSRKVTPFPEQIPWPR
jgi:hypothetical protein